MHAVQALHSKMQAAGLQVDYVVHLCSIEAAMEGWYKAGRNSDALVHIDQAFQDSPLLKELPVLQPAKDK